MLSRQPCPCWVLCLLLAVWTSQLPCSSALFDIFISSDQLETYFEGTENFDLVRGQMISIVRDGIPLVLEDGSLQLTEEQIPEGNVTGGSGSGMSPLVRRDAAVFSLPPLPARVDEVIISWRALEDEDISYQLMISGSPQGFFSLINSSVSEFGFIPHELSDFSVQFPCDPSADGSGFLLINITVVSTGEMQAIDFRLEKTCQTEATTTTTSVPPTITASSSLASLTSSFSFSPSPSSSSLVELTTPPPPPPPLMVTSQLPSLEPTLSPTPSILTTTMSTSTLLLLPSPSPSSPPASLVTPSILTSPSLVLSSVPPSPGALPSPSPLTTLLPPSPSSSLPRQPVTTPPLSAPPPTEDDSQFVMLLVIVFAPVVGTLFVSIFIVCCSICVCLCCCKKKSRKHFSDDPADVPVNLTAGNNYFYPSSFEMEEKKEDTPISLWMPLSWGSMSNLPSGIQGVVKRYSVDRRYINLLHTVSRGDYGCIVNGQLLSANQRDSLSGNKGVMMKMCIGFQKQYGHRDEISKFLECATLLRGLDHQNIHTPLKISVEDDYVPIVLYPIMEYGNLHQFLTLCRMTPADSPLSLSAAGIGILQPTSLLLPVTLQYKVSFAYQIIKGMEFLAANNIIHPDLALRNCFLDTNYQVKISDGALTQCFYPEYYFSVRGTVRPVRWAALETLQEGLCTTRSNVWSYGVTLWEVMTLAKLPYSSEVEHNRNVLTHLLMQNRLSCPQDCPENIYNIMTKCWKAQAEERPTLATIYSFLHEIHSKYAAVQTAAPPTTHGPSETNYSTFGKNIQPTALADHMVEPSRRVTKGAGNRGSWSRGSPSVSQRNSQNLLGVESASVGDRLSITFSVLSNENELDQTGSESECEILGEEMNIEIPSFLVGGEGGVNDSISEDLLQTRKKKRSLDQSHLGGGAGMMMLERSARAASPMDKISTFLPTGPSGGQTHDHVDHPTTFSPATASGRRPSMPATPTTSTRTPTPLLRRASEASSTSFQHQHQSGGTGSLLGNRTPPPYPASTPTTPDIVTTPAASVTPSNMDTISKPSSPDSVATYVSGPHPTLPTSHIPGIPSSTYNSTSVSIDDVKPRNRLLLQSSANNDHTITSASLASSTPSGASKTDSGIRSDEEMEPTVLNGGVGGGSGTGNGPLKEKEVSDVAPLGRETSQASSLGLSELSKDLMSAFASWGKD